MIDRRQNRNFAHEIGLCRIALVVDAVHRQMKTHPKLAEVFAVSGKEGEQRATLTYYWWVVLGGKELSDLPWRVIREVARTGISPELLGDWLTLFRQAALPILGEEFTGAWMQAAERVARQFTVNDEDEAVKLAKAS